MTPPLDELDLILAAARDWHAAGRGVALATVVETWGSAPRRVGSHMVIRDDGLFEGSVSGGCVEGDVIVEAQEVIATDRFRRLDYGVTDATAWQVGLACGGKISIVVQPLAEAGFPPALIGRLTEARRNGLSVTLTTDLTTGRTAIADAPNSGDFVHIYQPPLRLAIVGAVHIAQSLVPMARILGYAPLVIDPRGLFATADRFEGVTLDDRWPDEALADWRPNAASAIVTLTHDPKLDDVALAAALNSPAFYIGALGSRRTHAARIERLTARGFDAAALTRVHGPAGLDIGAASPSEIALSVLAQMTAAWRGKL